MLSEEVFAIEIYRTPSGKLPFIDWMVAMKDQRARAKIKARLIRVRLGNLGDHKSLGNGVYELRISTGSGYRVYFTHDSKKKVVLLGGSKKTQVKDIEKAREYLADYRGDDQWARPSRIMNI